LKLGSKSQSSDRQKTGPKKGREKITILRAEKTNSKMRQTTKPKEEHEDWKL